MTTVFCSLLQVTTACRLSEVVVSPNGKSGLHILACPLSGTRGELESCPPVGLRALTRNRMTFGL